MPNSFVLVVATVFGDVVDNVVVEKRFIAPFQTSSNHSMVTCLRLLVDLSTNVTLRLLTLLTRNRFL